MCFLLGYFNKFFLIKSFCSSSSTNSKQKFCGVPCLVHMCVIFHYKYCVIEIILFVEFWPKNFPTNQNTEFLKLQYLWNDLSHAVQFSHVIRNTRNKFTSHFKWMWTWTSGKAQDDAKWLIGWNSRMNWAMVFIFSLCLDIVNFKKFYSHF